MGLADDFEEHCALGIPDDTGSNVFADRYRAMEFTLAHYDELLRYLRLGEAVTLKTANPEIVACMAEAIRYASKHTAYGGEDFGISLAFAHGLLREGGFIFPDTEENGARPVSS